MKKISEYRNAICLIMIFFSNIQYAYLQNIANYSFSTIITGSLTDMSSGTTELALNSTTGVYHDDDASVVTSLPFTFYFMANAYDRFSVNSNGQLKLGSSTDNTAINGTSYTAPLASTALICPITGDNAIQATGKVHYKTTGTFPSRVFIVEWKDLRIPFSATPATGCWVQCLIYEGTGDIKYIYGAMYNNNAAAQLRTVALASSNTATTSTYIATITGTPTNTASATWPTTSFAATSSLVNLNSAADGSRRQFTYTPPTLAAPSGLSFTGVGVTFMTLNWADAAAEYRYAIYNSSDGGTTWNFVADVAQNSTSYNAIGLIANTTYNWRVYAVSEGCYSTPLPGTQATNACSITGAKRIGASGDDYTTIQAAFNACVLNGVSGPTILEIQSDYAPAGETFPITINSIPCASATNTVTLIPATGAAITLTSANVTATIDYNGGDYVTIDGRQGGVGAINMIIANTNTSGTAIRFINDASSNTVKYCDLKGVNTSTTGGVIVSTTLAGSTGNDDNIIEYNNIHEGASTPTNILCFIGAATIEHSGNIIRNNNIYNFFHATFVSEGIRVSTYCTGFTISNNSVYQTVSRAPANIFYGIDINTSINGANFIISGNYIGGTGPNCTVPTGVMTLTGSATFVAIVSNIDNASPIEIQGNTIANISVTTSSTGSQSCISVPKGAVNCGNTTPNIIGSQSATGSIAFVLSGASGNSNGIRIGTSAGSTSYPANVSNNQIGGISVSGAGATQFTGIYIGATQTYTTCTISGNTIGSATVTNSINVSITTDNGTAGIYSSTASTSLSISNNILQNITSSSINVAALINGIFSSSGVNTISGNTLTLFTSASKNTAGIAMIGISLNTTTGGHIISGNTIHSLTLSDATTALFNYGINFVSASTGTNIIEKNNIHSLITASATAIQRGIRIVTPSAVICKNNMIRLGLKPDGTTVTTAANINGIYSTSVSACDFYNNSIYIGGTLVVGAAVNTMAFYINATPGGTVNIQNNIFVNARSNTSGTAKHYAYSLSSIANVTSDYNIYYVSGTGGILANIATVDQTGTTAAKALQALRFSITGQDLHSANGDPLFVTPAGTSATVNLHVSGATPAEGSGILISSVTTDFDGETRSSLSPTDIGADAGNYTALNTTSDIFTPVITYTPLTNGANAACTGGTRTLTATITDMGTAVPTAGGTIPRIWFKKNAGAWFSAAGTLASGDGNNGTWTFTITYATMGGVVNNDIIYYYVVAQDQATSINIWYNSFESAAPYHSNVSTQTTAPAAPRSFTILPALSGVITVGVGEPIYHSLTEAGAAGLFNAINTGVVTGNIIANITTSITESGATVLNQWAEDCGSNFTLTIQSSAAVQRVLSGTQAGNLGLVRINGADRVTITGGAANYLLFRNTNATAANAGAAIELYNGSENCTITNCILESNQSSAGYGVLTVGPGVGTANANITISNNKICKSTGGTVGPPYAGIYLNNIGTNLVTISGNSIYDFSNSGVYVLLCGDNVVISGNSIYQTAAVTTALKGVNISGGNHLNISGNYIGGQSASCGGSPWTTSNTGVSYGVYILNGTNYGHTISNNFVKNFSLSGTTSTFKGIYVSTAATEITNITGNTVSNVAFTSANTGSNFSGIEATSRINISDNIIGSATVANSITSAGIGDYFGIYSAGEFSDNMHSGNLVANISSTATAGIPEIWGIRIMQGSVKKNKVFKLSAGTAWGNLYGITLETSSATANCEVSNNMISLDGGTADHLIRGIRVWANTGSIFNLYNNSVYIYGAISASVPNHTEALARDLGSYINCRNNIFMNYRTGTTTNYAFNTNSTSLSRIVSNYNLLCAPALGKIVNDFTTPVSKTFATWQADLPANNDPNSWSVITAASSSNTQVLPTDLFTDPANGDLTIKTAYGTVDWYVSGKGVAGALSGSLASDFGAGGRGVTYQYSTDIGADEYGTSFDFGTTTAGNQVSPHTLTLSTWALNTPQTFTFAGRNIATLEFKTGTVPTSVDVKFYSGDNPENDAAGSLTGKKYSNVWYSVAPTGGSGYTYDLTLYYDNAMLGTVIAEASMGIAKWANPYGASDSWTTQTTTINTTSKTGKITGQSTFSRFVFVDETTPLPIELLGFSAKCFNNTAELIWTTASETNNDYFTIEHSKNAIEFSAIANVNGSGTTTISHSYSTSIIGEDPDFRYYRLKQTDYDGHFSYSDIIYLGCSDTKPTYSNLTLFPNPATNEVNINFGFPVEGSYSISIRNVLGQEVKKVDYMKNENNGIHLLINDLQDGIYFLKMNDVSHIGSIPIMKFIVQKR